MKETTQPRRAKAQVRPLPRLPSVGLSLQVTGGLSSPCPGHLPACHGLGWSQGTRYLTGTAQKQKQYLQQTEEPRSPTPPNSFCPRR